MNESSIRSMALRHGMKLQKGRTKAAQHYGPDCAYRVIDLNSNCVLFGGGLNGYGGSLIECADFIREAADDVNVRWQKWKGFGRLAK
jgi:hypothetical protein